MADTDFLKTVAAAALAMLLLGLALRLLKTPLRRLLRLALSSLLGFAVLLALNLLGAPLGLRLGLNPLNAAVVGVLGLPGVVLLLLLQYLL